MFGNGMTAIFLQLRARQHFGVKGLLLCTGMRGYFFAKFGKCFAPLRAVTFGFCDLFEKFTMLVMIFFEQVEYLRHTYVDRKSTRLNSSHVRISYAVFCLKKKI